MVDPIEILKYYSSDKFDPELPDNVQNRHFRFKRSDGTRWRKVPFKIHNTDDLKKWIQRLGGIDLYYSTSEWLNPQKVSTKKSSGTYMVADNLVLSNDLVFDIDAKEPITHQTLDEARKVTWNIYKMIDLKYNRQYEFKYCAFTGYKGFRLVYKDNCKLPMNPRRRLDSIIKNRKLFISDLLKELKENASPPQFYKVEPVFDEKITINPLCVIRVIGSVHSETGFITVKIAPTTLRKSIKQILADVPHVGKEMPGIPLKQTREMTTRGDNPCPRPIISGKDGSGITSLPISSHKFYITNKVLGVRKGFVPFFVYQPTQTYYLKELERLQNKYRLGWIYLFKDNNNIIAISLKTMQRRQLHKVLVDSTSKTKHDFRKHRRIFVPMDLGFVSILKGPYTGHLSKGHYMYVSQHTNNKLDLCGWPKIELVIVENPN